MPANVRTDPLPRFKFLVEIEGQCKDQGETEEEIGACRDDGYRFAVQRMYGEEESGEGEGDW